MRVSQRPADVDQVLAGNRQGGHVDALLVCQHGAGNGTLERAGELLRGHAFDFSSS